MAYTVNDIVTNSMLNIGAIAIGETPTAPEAQNALQALNGLLETWNTESLTVYSVDQEVFDLTPGQGTYTMGPGGDFDTTRPVQIEEAYARDDQDNDYYMAILNYEEYSEIISKNTTSSIPTMIYPDNNFPLQNIKVWPIPNDTTYRLVLWRWQNIEEFEELADAVILPPGYRRALETNLSLELGPRYGRAISPDLMRLAVKSKAQIQRNNYVLKTMFFDPTLTRQGRVFNWKTGDYY